MRRLFNTLKPPRIFAEYKGTVSQTMEASGAGEVVNFDTKVTDTWNCVTTGAAWAFTAPLPGLYQVEFFIYFQGGAWAATNEATADLRVGGTIVHRLADMIADAAVTKSFSLGGSKIMNLAKGEAFDIFVDHNRAAGDISLSANENVWITVAYLGPLYNAT